MEMGAGRNCAGRSWLGRERLDEELKTAMRDRNDVCRSVLRMVRSEVHNEEIARQKPLDNEAIVGVLFRQARRSRESISEFRRGRREDLHSERRRSFRCCWGISLSSLFPKRWHIWPGKPYRR
ncbi:MAG: GatB/YqeY domain-containing protein [Chloroflexi bacterium]|nr:GatB/YqeY domain-containing protein [Chloroflexota bacterium]